MFDTVGRTQQQSLKQQAASMGLALLTSGGMLAGLWWAGRQVVEQVLENEEIEVTFFDAAPPPPPPPPPPAGGGEKPKTEKTEKKPDPVEVEPTPDELPEEPEEQPEEVPEEAAADAGVEGGVVGGVEGGVVGGVIGGVGGGVLGGELGGTGLRAVHHTQIKIKRQVQPVSPPAARELGLTEERCVATISVDEEGKPFDVKVDGCPAIFHEAVSKAALATRFYPYKVDGVAIRLSTKIGYTFKVN
jgi:hypothetical protein